ncbi:response regulator transcription factor [Streptomyces rugosispiralis]|uniref:Response regulator transcription factor n=1 Tax=Streptomyces rugosispiralis TaxID=2967341 RepID=A0ABT1UQX3_9ACTN|nr:response regulator transcription factor [Streptomyces rugosispiralis]MCQ8187034.1 response regulator transcription factor [Streptomyces rugosispiralis]
MIRVLLADDDPLVRTGLKMMLRGADGIEVVGEASDGAEVTAAVREHTPDVVLMDIRMPVVDGLAATRELTRGGAQSPQVIVLTTFDEHGLVLEAMRSGAAGYLVKHAVPEEIVEAVRRAAGGEPALSPSAARALIRHAAGGPGGPDDRAERARQRLALLTEREREVAEAVAEGLSNTDIGTRLHLSLGTVKAHLSSALAKLDLDNRVQLALLTHDAHPRP